MDDKEKKQKAYIMVLICCTIFTIALNGESFLLGWDMTVCLLLLVGLLLCWWIYIAKKVPQNTSLWINVILTMVTFFFYGSHRTSVYDLAPVMIILMIIYSSTENKNIIKLCMVTYYLTMVYDFIFVLKGFDGFDSLAVTRTLLHFGLVYMGGYITQLEIERKGKEKHITEEKIVELEESNRRTEDFLTNVSHELRTPINAVTGITATMLRTEEAPDKRKNISAIQKAGHRLFNQVNDILDFTELDTGRVKLSEESYMVSSLINDIISSNRLDENSDKLELIIDIDASMPSVLVGDAGKVKKIIKHLLDNGLKFTKDGGVYVKLWTMPKPYGVNLCIKVVDTGIGMSDENLLKIKERFYQNNSSRNRRKGGLGLGLSIVYGMVSAMEGFIQIESAPGKGTTVSVSIPQKVADASAGMTIKNKDKLFVACFLEPEKYIIPEVRTFYNEMISGLVNGLDIPLRRISGIDELKLLVSKYQLTHLFIGKEEYRKHLAYLEELDKNIEIVVVSDEELRLPPTGQFKLLRKPIYCLPVANILNSGSDDDHLQNGVMSCPGVSVLVVDDEPMNLMVAEGIFKGYKMQVRTVQSGFEALEVCEKEHFDLIFMDHMMPEMDGVETMKRLRKLHIDDDNELTIIAFTANAVSGAREMFLDEGFDEFLSKPIEDCELQRVLRKTLPKSAIVYTEAESPHYESDTDADAAADTANDTTAIDASKNIVDEPDKTNPADDIDALGQSGFNIASGLSYCGNDRGFYKELLVKYARDYDKKHEQMEVLYGARDWDNYRIQVHALKSTSRMIGADKLSEQAYDMEEAAKKHDAEFIDDKHAQLMKLYGETANAIIGRLCAETVTACDNAAQNGNVNVDELLEVLSQLRKCLSTYEEDRALELLNKLEDMQYGANDFGAVIEQIKQDVDEFEFDAAGEKADKLIDRMKGGEAR